MAGITHQDALEVTGFVHAAGYQGRSLKGIADAGDAEQADSSVLFFPWSRDGKGYLIPCIKGSGAYAILT